MATVEQTRRSRRLTRQMLFWSATFLAMLLFFFIFNDILLPFVAGMVLAYILDPLADRFEAIGFSRMAATLTILILFIILFVLILLGLIPVLGKQLGQFIENIPTHVKAIQGVLVSDRLDWVNNFISINKEEIQGYIGDLMNQAAAWLSTLLTSIWSGGQAVISVLSLLVITPVVAFYLLYDWDNMIAKIDEWLPREHAPTIRELTSEMADMVAGFVRGQGTVCIILGILYALGLSLVGLNFGLLIGLMAGLISFIPFVGSIVGFILAIGVALAQFWPESNYLMILIVAGIFFAGQFIEGNILQPRLVGGHVRLHPVWLMFALFAFGSLFGFLGMLVAVPAAASIGVLVRFGIRQYLQSSLYLGDD